MIMSMDILARCPRPVALLAKAIDEARLEIKNFDRTAKQKEGEGHRSVITDADETIQRYILSALDDRSVRFICEEVSGDPRVISPEFPGVVFEGLRIIIDPIDGTSLYAGNFPEWCIGGGVMIDGVLVGSVISAPDCNGGTTIISSEGHGLAVSEREGSFRAVPGVGLSRRTLKQSIILRGVDTELYANITSMMPRIAAGTRAVYTMGSAHFGLMSVALRRAAAIIQTPQKAWDWAPAYHAVTATGGVFRFFRIENGTVIPVGGYDEESFLPGGNHRLGFVAGEPDTAEWLFSELPINGWERYNPDTI
jgi:fructose-1,6-bisphosphatase/inositol monophosphatase family enzyme